MFAYFLPFILYFAVNQSKNLLRDESCYVDIVCYVYLFFDYFSQEDVKRGGKNAGYSCGHYIRWVCS